MKSIKQMILPGSKDFSPKGLLVRAGFLFVLFVICHLAGFREYTSVLCGTPAAPGATAHLLAFLGLIYVLMYLFLTVVVPVLIIAAGLLFVYERINGACCKDLRRQ